MVIADICKFFHRLTECYLGSELVQIGAFIFQGVEISFHRSIVSLIKSYSFFHNLNSSFISNFALSNFFISRAGFPAITQ